MASPPGPRGPLSPTLATGDRFEVTHTWAARSGTFLAEGTLTHDLRVPMGGTVGRAPIQLVLTSRRLVYTERLGDDTSTYDSSTDRLPTEPARPYAAGLGVEVRLTLDAHAEPAAAADRAALDRRLAQLFQPDERTLAAGIGRWGSPSRCGGCPSAS